MTIAPVTGVTAEFIAELNANFAAIDSALNANVPPGALPIGGQDGQFLQAITAGSASVWKYPGEVGSPQPNFATWLQACVTAGISANWVWGNVTLAAPVAITVTSTIEGFVFDGHGAIFTAGFTNTAADLLSFTIPDSAAASLDGFTIQNVTLLGQHHVRHCLYLSCKLAQSGMFGVKINNVNWYAAHDSGFKVYGNIFEFYGHGLVGQDNDSHGIEFTNPTAGGGTGVISSIHLSHFDFRTNGGNGIASTADTAFQNPPQCPYASDGDLIQNNAEGISAPAGCYARDLHLENNCNAAIGNSAISISFSEIVCENCISAASNGQQVYLINFVGGGGNILRSPHAFNGPVAHLQNTGSILVEPSQWANAFTGVTGLFDGNIAGWNIWTPRVSTYTAPITAATYTVSISDTDLIANRAGTITLTLLASPIAYAGCKLNVKTIQAQTVVSASANVVPRAGGAAGTAILAAAAGNWAELMFDGTNWLIMKGS
jgi:hypothetical protein